MASEMQATRLSARILALDLVSAHAIHAKSKGQFTVAIASIDLRKNRVFGVKNGMGFKTSVLRCDRRSATGLLLSFLQRDMVGPISEGLQDGFVILAKKTHLHFPSGLAR